MSLSDEQVKFLDHSPLEHARLLAGPGTGKSFTSVQYLEKILSERPSLRVGYITFTRAATAEFLSKLTTNGIDVEPKTMHGFSLGILLRHKASGIPYPVRILDSWETKNIAWPDITALLKQKGFSNVTPKVVGKLEQEMASGFQSLNSIKLPLAEEFPQLVNAYKGVWHWHRSQYGYTLLSELTYHASQVLADITEVDMGLDLLIVDEYQDLNYADQKVLIELANRGIAIIAIGDDDQSIYSWRNAAPDGIREFLTTFSAEYDYPLTLSMRCGGKALEVASDLIELDPSRPLKKRLTPSSMAKDTEFHYLRYKNNIGEARGVARIVAKRIADGVKPKDISILVRSSIPVWTKSLKEELVVAGIPVGETEDIKALLSSPNIRKAIAMSQLLLNENDSVAWRALLKITKGIGDKFVAAILLNEHAGNFSEKLINALSGDFADIKRGKKEATMVIHELYDWVQKVDLDNVVLTEDGWGGWLLDQPMGINFSDKEKEMLLLVGRFLGTGITLRRFVAEIEPTARELSSAASSGVRIMSMSQSKGLTVNTAIVMGIEGGRMPAPGRDEDEERRIFYVALTRATDMTVVTYANTRTGQTARLGSQSGFHQQEQSPFMRQLSDIKIEDGDAFLN